MGGHTTTEQKKLYLPELASGQKTASLAISEPGRGNHPKSLQTAAVFRDGFWYITGEKSYLSNGPFADLFIVLAITGITNNIKEYTAFIIPADSPGLTRTQPLPLKVFKPSPHCGIKLENCKVPDSSILGEKGKAYKSIAIPFRDAEDLLIMGPVLGCKAALMKIITENIIHKNLMLNHELKTELGMIHSSILAMRTLCLDAAVMMDSQDDPEELACILLAVKAMADKNLDNMESFYKNAGLEENPEWRRIMDDLRFAVRLAENIRRIRAEKQADIILGKR